MEALRRAARALADRHANACGVNADDNWKQYAEDFIADARAMVAALSEGQAPEPVAQEPKCGISWNGFNLSGDSASIDEAKRGIHALGIVPQLKEEIRRLRAGMDAARAKAIEARPDFLASLAAAFPELDATQLSAVTRYAMSLATKGAGS